MPGTRHRPNSEPRRDRVSSSQNRRSVQSILPMRRQRQAWRQVQSRHRRRHPPHCTTLLQLDPNVGGSDDRLSLYLAGFLRHLAHRSIDPRGFKNCECSSQERIDVALRVSAHRMPWKSADGPVRLADQFIFPLLNGTVLRIVGNRSAVPVRFYRKRITLDSSKPSS